MDTFRRPAVGASAAMIAGIAAGWAARFYPLSVLALCLAVLGAEVWGRSDRRALPTFLWVSFLVGLVYAHLVSAPASPLPQEDPPPALMVGRVVGPIARGPEVGSFLLVPTSGAGTRIRVTAPVAPLAGLSYGDLIEATLLPRPPPSYFNPGGFRYDAYLAHRDVVAVATLDAGADLRRLTPGGNPVLRRVYAWRERIRRQIVAGLEGPAEAILLAIVIGENGYLTAHIRDDFMASGTTHILSISGSHLGLVALVVFGAVRRAVVRLPAALLLALGNLGWTPRRVAAAATIPPVVFYALLAGGQVATIRSLVMILVYLAAVLLRRPDDLLNALGLAALGILVFDPLALFEISFQLSFVSVTLIALALEWQERVTPRADPAPDAQPDPGRARLLRWAARARGALLLALAATAGTAPLVAYHFNQIAWVGLFANLIVVPFAGILIVPLGLIAALAGLVVGAETLPLAGWNQFLADAFYATVRAFAAFPGAELHVGSGSLLTLALLMAAVVWILRSPRVTRFGWGVALLAICLPAVWLAGQSWRPFDGKLRAAFLDVGQGDAAVVRFPDRTSMVIDGGLRWRDFDLGRIVVGPYLWDHGIRRIDYLVATHPQADHIGGLIYLLERFSVGEVWENGTIRDSPLAEGFRDEIRARRLAHRTISRDPIGEGIGLARVRILNPDSGFSPAGENDRSIVLKIEYGGFSVLLTGDIERGAEQAIAAPEIRSTLLKVPHHGSRTSSTAAFLDAVAPEAAVISVGRRNVYGHPAPEVVAAYEARGARLYRTDRDGAILVETDGKSWRVRAARQLLPREVALDRHVVSAEWDNWRRWWEARRL